VKASVDLRAQLGYAQTLCKNRYGQRYHRYGYVSCSGSLFVARRRADGWQVETSKTNVSRSLGGQSRIHTASGDHCKVALLAVQIGHLPPVESRFVYPDLLDLYPHSHFARFKLKGRSKQENTLPWCLVIVLLWVGDMTASYFLVIIMD
jgi:hypothetical protein